MLNFHFNTTLDYINEYKKQLSYLLIKGNTIHEFCLCARNIYENNENDLANLQLKKINKKMKNITILLNKIVQDYDN